MTIEAEKLLQDSSPIRPQDSTPICDTQFQSASESHLPSNSWTPPPSISKIQFASRWHDIPLLFLIVTSLIIKIALRYTSFLYMNS